jgi:predicted aldo/keto reductase-like oxidoreductase
MYQHPSDWHNNQGVIRQAEEHEMGIILMRPLTSGVFQRLMAWAAETAALPEIDVLDVGRLLLNYVLSDPYVDVVSAGAHEPRFVKLNNGTSDDVASRIDGCEAHIGGAARSVRRIGKKSQGPAVRQTCDLRVQDPGKPIQDGDLCRH